MPYVLLGLGFVIVLYVVAVREVLSGLGNGKKYVSDRHLERD